MCHNAAPWPPSSPPPSRASPTSRCCAAARPGRAPVALLVEVPHGADRADYDAVRAQIDRPAAGRPARVLLGQHRRRRLAAGPARGRAGRRRRPAPHRHRHPLPHPAHLHRHQPGGGRGRGRPGRRRHDRQRAGLRARRRPTAPGCWRCTAATWPLVEQAHAALDPAGFLLLPHTYGPRTLGIDSVGDDIVEQAALGARAGSGRDLAAAPRGRTSSRAARTARSPRRSTSPSGSPPPTARSASTWARTRPTTSTRARWPIGGRLACPGASSASRCGAICWSRSGPGTTRTRSCGPAVERFAAPIAAAIDDWLRSARTPASVGRRRILQHRGDLQRSSTARCAAGAPAAGRRLAPRLLRCSLRMALDAHVKRYFWVVRAAVIVVCSAFAATAVAHVIAATAFAERADPVRRPALARPAASSRSVRGADPDRRRAGRAQHVLLHLLAGSRRRPSASTATGPVATELPLRLVATNVSRARGALVRHHPQHVNRPAGRLPRRRAHPGRRAGAHASSASTSTSTTRRRAGSSASRCCQPAVLAARPAAPVIQPPKPPKDDSAGGPQRAPGGGRSPACASWTTTATRWTARW